MDWNGLDCDLYQKKYSSRLKPPKKGEKKNYCTHHHHHLPSPSPSPPLLKKGRESRGNYSSN